MEQLDSENKKFFVYAFLDPRKPGVFEYDNYTFNYEPFYIGKGKNKRDTDNLRLSFDNKDKSNPYKNNKIKRIVESTNSFPIIIKIIENVDENSAFECEKKLIQKIGRPPFGPLTNIADGGWGGNTCTTDEIKKRTSEKSRETQNSLSEKGKHNFQDPDFIEKNKERISKNLASKGMHPSQIMSKNKTHPFLNEDFKKRNAKKTTERNLDLASKGMHPSQIAAKEKRHSFQNPEFIKNNSKRHKEYMKEQVEKGTAYWKSEEHSKLMKERIANGTSQKERIIKQLKDMIKECVDINETNWNSKPFMRQGRISWSNTKKYFSDFDKIIEETKLDGSME